MERFTSVNSEWPISVHDSRIWKNSDIGRFMKNYGTDALLLGDSGYGIAPWLMTFCRLASLSFECRFASHSQQSVSS
jgi:hypothetical protein